MISSWKATAKTPAASARHGQPLAPYESAGFDAGQMVTALRHHARYGVPPNVEVEILELASRYGRVVITREGDALRCSCFDEITAERLSRDRDASPVLTTRFDKTSFRINPDQRGILKRTLVVVMGEFGRTPIINKDGGRDHHSRVFSMVLAGGGIKGGTVVGESDARGIGMKRTEFARLTQAKWLDYIWRTKSVLTRGYKAVRSQSSRSRNVFILHGNRVH